MEQQGKNSRNTQELVEPKNNSQIDSNPQLGQSQKIQLQQEYPLIERQFHVRRKNQYQNLLDTNINVLLKKKLFGFAKSADIFYRTNMDTQLVFEKHPLKGRTIMPLQKFEKREQDRQRTAQIQQKNIACKTPKQMGSGLPRTAVTKSKRRERYDPLQQMVRKKIQKVDESIQNLLVVDSHKNLIMDQNI